MNKHVEFENKLTNIREKLKIRLDQNKKDESGMDSQATESPNVFKEWHNCTGYGNIFREDIRHVKV